MMGLDEAEIAVVLNPRSGLATKCRYLPTPADIYDFMREYERRRDQFKPVHTAWKELQPDAYREPDAAEIERRKGIVREAIGRQPGYVAKQAPTQADFDLAEEIERKGASALKTPSGPPTRELVEFLVADGYECEATRDLIEKGNE